MSAIIALARPRTVTITLWGVFILGAWNVGRALTLGQQSRLLLEFGVVPDPRWRLIIALMWSSLFWGLTILLKRKRPITRQAIPLLILVYALFELGFLFFFAQAMPARRAWLVNMVFYGILFLFVSWALNRPAAKVYFKAS